MKNLSLALLLSARSGLLTEAAPPSALTFVHTELLAHLHEHTGFWWMGAAAEGLSHLSGFAWLTPTHLTEDLRGGQSVNSSPKPIPTVQAAWPHPSLTARLSTTPTHLALFHLLLSVWPSLTLWPCSEG